MPASRTTLNVDPDAAEALRRLCFQKHGKLSGGVVKQEATAAINAWVKDHQGE